MPAARGLRTVLQTRDKRCRMHRTRAMSSVGADLSAVSDYLVDATRGRLRHPLRVSQQRPPQRHDDRLTTLGLIAKQADPIDDCRRALVSSPADDARRADRDRPRPGQLLRPSGWLRFAARHVGHLFPYLHHPPSGVAPAPAVHTARAAGGFGPDRAGDKADERHVLLEILAYPDPDEPVGAADPIGVKSYY